MARYRPKVGPVSVIFQSLVGIKLEVPALSLFFNYPTSVMATFQLAVAPYPSSPVKRLVPRTKEPPSVYPEHSQWQQLLAP